VNRLQPQLEPKVARFLRLGSRASQTTRRRQPKVMTESALRHGVWQSSGELVATVNKRSAGAFRSINYTVRCAGLR
jgi:hypothetical protein